MVIFLIGMIDFCNEERGLVLGVLDYIIKFVVVFILKVWIKNYLEMKCKNDLLIVFVWLDGFINIFNWRLFDFLLYQEWSCSVRYSWLMLLMMIDVDFFKWYNDIYGYIVGDDCL